jgi:hypothetical protein
MEREAVETLLADAELVPAVEASVPQAKELERQLLSHDIPVMLARPPSKACCSGKCGCGTKVQLLVRKDDLSRVSHVLQSEWLQAVEREGTGGAARLVQLGVPGGESPDGELPCPACGCAAPLVEGACSDCGLQLE